MLNNEWKSIETAPDNPEELHYRGLWVWTTNYEGKRIPCYFQSSLGYVSDEDGSWVQSDMDYCGWDIEDFTHWHECPKLPEAK